VVKKSFDVDPSTVSVQLKDVHVILLFLFLYISIVGIMHLFYF
jgi:hypothetical protein